MKWTQTNRSVLSIDLDVSTPCNEWEQWVQLRSDEHLDNAKCRRDILKRDLDEALARDAMIIQGGDLLCLMQGKYDPRSSQSALMPQHRGDTYLDKVSDDAIDFLKPYAKNFAALGRGNHETNVIKRHHTDMTERVAAGLNREGGGSVVTMGYGYWVRFKMTYKTQRRSFWLKVYHGSGGGGEVTRGTIRTNRMAVYLPDADIVMCGHTHDAYALPIMRERVNAAGTVYHSAQWHIRTPTYKDEYQDGHGGWHIERGGPPKPLGCYWLRFYMRNNAFGFDVIPQIQTELSML